MLKRPKDQGLFAGCLGLAVVAMPISLVIGLGLGSLHLLLIQGHRDAQQQINRRRDYKVISQTDYGPDFVIIEAEAVFERIDGKGPAIKRRYKQIHPK